jgi:hypothetical protein
MRYATSSALKWILVGVAGFGGYELYKHMQPASKRAGVGDTVVVNTAALPTGGLPAGIPAGVAQLVVQIGTATADAISGTIMGYYAGGAVQTLPITGPVFPGNIPRTAIVGIVTADGKVAA